MSIKSFIDKCLDGEALIFDIDDYVKKWHSEDYNITLQEFLGMSKHEYNAWMIDDSILSYIIKAHKENIDFDVIIQDDVEKIAARDCSKEEVVKLIMWLNKNAR